MSDPKQPGDLKPGFYYVRPKDYGSWNVGVMEIDNFDGKDHQEWWLPGYHDYFISDELEIGAYLDPQPGERQAEVLNCVAYENKKKIDEG